MGCGASKDDAPLFESPNLCTSACGCLGFRLRVQATVPPRVGAAPAAAPLRPRPPLSASSPQYLYPPPLPPPTPAPVADHFVEVLFFPDPALPCREHYRSPGGCSRGDRCKYAHSTTSLSRLLAMLDAVRCTIDVCVFTITSDEIAQHILAAAARGVRVRVITDDGQAKTTGSEIETFVAAGIEVRHDKSYTFMVGSVGGWAQVCGKLPPCGGTWTSAARFAQALLSTLFVVEGLFLSGSRPAAISLAPLYSILSAKHHWQPSYSSRSCFLLSLCPLLPRSLPAACAHHVSAAPTSPCLSTTSLLCSTAACCSTAPSTGRAPRRWATRRIWSQAETHGW